ncbi:MAG: CPBP family intramembrane metalloprotease [Verrucomicrobia bacterium]|nr:CPBP family intramembrane metalloprotease [Verrucomicrobiota bacterium]
MNTAGLYVDYVELILFFGLLAFGLNWLAASRGYFTLHPRLVPAKGVLKFSSVIVVFAIYLIMSMVVSSILVHLVQSIYSIENMRPPFTAMGWVQLTIILLTLFFFYFYTKTLEPSLVRRIIKDRSVANSKAIPWDFCMGIMTWIISFPLVIAVGQLVDMLLYIFSGFENYEQVAVRYLKMTLSSPPMLAVALFTILLAAPAIEEFLFRGFLQTYFKRYMSVKWAIVLSSLCFALFHFAPSQGIGNISLVASLFTFALYLGFIYERQGSLFASFALHVTFNTFSTFRIMFFPDS